MTIEIVIMGGAMVASFVGGMLFTLALLFFTIDRSSRGNSERD